MYQPAPAARPRPRSERDLERFLRMKAREEERRRLQQENKSLLEPDRFSRNAGDLVPKGAVDAFDFPGRVVREALGMEGTRIPGINNCPSRMDSPGQLRGFMRGREGDPPMSKEAWMKSRLQEREAEQTLRELLRGGGV